MGEKRTRIFMSRQFRVVLEYDGKNPIRNTFLCKIDELEYSSLRDWEDLYGGDLDHYSSKKDSLKTREELYGCYACRSWGIESIVSKIEAIKREIELDIEQNEDGKIKLNQVICNLQLLHDIALSKCEENNIEPEKCYIKWWIDF